MDVFLDMYEDKRGVRLNRESIPEITDAISAV